MTFSIIARCPDTGQVGVAATTAVPAVGKLVTHAHPAAGAVATQAQLNPYLGIDGLRLLQEGHPAAAVRDRLARLDPRIQRRQFAVLDLQGGTAAWTGDCCLDWAGHSAHEGYCVQGNRLTGPDVLHATAAAFRNAAGQPLADRFLAALAAGTAAGGDAKGERSATIYVMDSEEYPLWDIRVDDAEDPLAELHRLHRLFREKLLPQIRRMPTRADPGGDPTEESA